MPQACGRHGGKKEFLNAADWRDPSASRDVGLQSSTILGPVKTTGAYPPVRNKPPLVRRQSASGHQPVCDQGLLFLAILRGNELPKIPDDSFQFEAHN